MLLDGLQQNKATAIGFIPKYVIEFKCDQNSDLDKFECTKCVHISNLDFLDPMMFYKLREF
jgi:hypothetical protein